ncbi:MAG: methyltransferase domain-containing protein [Lewinella sp.]|nr:methyltransferase domain-containing protein [Lewinella sp.]
MKVTKLVVLFKYRKILLGLLVAAACAGLAWWAPAPFLTTLLLILAGLVFLSIFLAIGAAFWLYDHANLYEAAILPSVIMEGVSDAILLHASFDPLSRNLEAAWPGMKLRVFDLYGNRHEHDPGIKVSKRIFLPHPAEIQVNPTQLPLPDSSQDVLIGVTALHEIQPREDRVLFFKEAKRVLRPGGRLVMIEQMRNGVNFLCFNIGAFHFLRRKDWEETIAAGGLTIIDTEKITPFAERLILGK